MGKGLDAHDDNMVATNRYDEDCRNRVTVRGTLSSIEFKAKRRDGSAELVPNTTDYVGCTRTVTSVAETSVKCVFLNARSIVNKLADLECLIVESQADVLGIAETWCTADINDSELEVKGYRLVRRDRLEGRGGGVLLLVKDNIFVKALKCPSNDDATESKVESVWCEVMVANSNMKIGVCYRNREDPEVDEGICKMIRWAGRGNCLLMGDFNHPEIDWETWEARSQSGRKFLDALDDCHVRQYIKDSTRGQNILDLVLYNGLNDITDINIHEPLASSDHCVLSWNMRWEIARTKIGGKGYDFTKADFNNIRMDLSNSDWRVDDCNDIEVAWCSFKNVLESCIRKHVPLKTYNYTRRSKWVTKGLLNEIKLKKSKWDDYRLSGDPVLYEEYKAVCNKVTSMIRHQKAEYERHLAMRIKTNNKLFYAYVNSKRKDRTTISTLRNNNDEIIQSTVDIANTLNIVFSSNFVDEDSQLPPASGFKQDVLTDVEINESKIAKVMKNLNCYKSPGPDNIHPRVVKEGGLHLIKPLLHIMRLTLDSGLLPNDWKLANITPILKKGDREDPKNYRPVSLTSIVCKLMESILKDIIMEHLGNYKLLKETQFGFTRGKSCLTNLLSYYDWIVKAIDGGNNVDVIYLDFSKAFDSVPHKRLLRKLESYGISGKVLSWISNWLMGRKQRVVTNGVTSEWADVKSGVPQGSVLGPLLFLIYIDDIDANLKGRVAKFADDIKIGGVVNGVDESAMLQNDLDALYEWSEMWQLQFNASKCKVVHFGRNNPRVVYKLGGQTLIAESEEKDLGVVIQNDMKFDRQCRLSAKKANAVLSMIFRNVTSRDKNVIMPLYRSLVRPHLDYCAQLWRPHYARDISILERVQRRATRFVVGARGKAYEERLRICGITSLKVRQMRGDLIQVFKFVKGFNSMDGMSLFDMCCNRNTRGHQYRITKPRFRLDIMKHSFSVRVVRNWNKLPEQLVNVNKLEDFKKGLDIYINDNVDQLE